MITCTHCSTVLDPDSPGSACAVCHAETGAHPGSDPPSPSVPRRRAFRRLENILQVVVVANALRESAGRDRLTDEDLRTASSICRSEVLA